MSAAPRDCDPAEARALQAAGAPLIDVREPVEVAEGKAAGAQPLPLAELDVGIAALAPRRDQPLLLICASGQRSRRAAESLAARGYTRALSVRGGLQRWLAEGHPFEAPDAAEARWRERYARQLILPEIGEAGQRRLQAARVLLVGAGGLGSPSALYLAGAGVGTLGLIDHDTVDRSNLHRQVLHRDAGVGTPKVDSALQTLSALNPDITLHAHRERLTADNIERLFADYDVIVDGSDNFPTRYLVSDACVSLGKPNVYAAVQGFEGQVAVFPAGGRPCYRCLFAEAPPAALAPSCNTVGVLGVIPGIVGLLQALAVLNLLLGFGETPVARLQLFDGRRGTLRNLRLAADPACAHCADGAPGAAPVNDARACANAP